ncbi:Substrate-specific component CbrT of putative cobalamin ECF transporter [Streptococcus sp. DD10]|uniref:hypothetical protein n=1 Tax=Streptococcus sp. DD10 TaxID=1777878 RepID=UPI00079902B8|nr:hypothetical protein [Streptococcus sp. DD10]KXT77124.1 Substrate-specific component CbrT of putative cobalamin ECF transporter [Streptococcus sp. DD10]
MTVRKITQLTFLVSLSVVLRYLFGPFPNIKPITALFLVIGLQLGLGEAILVANLVMLITGFLLGFGPWILWQMGTYTLVLLFWRVLVCPFTSLFSNSTRIGFQAVLAGLMGMLYGFIISIFSALFYGSSFLPYWLNGLMFDCLHAVSTIMFYPVILSIFRRFYHEEIQ